MKKYFAKMDLWLLTFTVIYAAIGAIMIYSASSILTVLSQGVASTYYFRKQIIVIIASFIASLVVLRVPTKKYKYFEYFSVILVIVLLMGLGFYGKVVNGAKGWYDFGIFNLQPAEFAKSVLIIFMAIYYSELINKNDRNLVNYFIPIGIALVIIGLIIKQPDIGSAAIITLLVFLLFICLPFNKVIKSKTTKIVTIGLTVTIFLALTIGPKLISSYQLQRFTFQEPCTRYREATGYQVCNGFIAIKNGGVFGLGFGNSTQKYLYLPEAHTDFIFPIICEELGIIVGGLIILGYGFMLWRILLIAKKATNIRNSILAYGTFIYLSLHIIINLLGVLALMPLTGVPLPLLSYGGSFNINVILLLFMCQRISIESKESKIKEKIAKL